MGPHWPGHYFCRFEKHLPQPEINSMRRIHLEITILERQYFVGFYFHDFNGQCEKRNQVSWFRCFQIKKTLKGHNQLWDRTDLDTTFASLKSLYLNLKSNLCIGYISKSASVQPLFHSILDLLLKTSFWANFYPSYYIILSYLVKNSIQRNMNRRGEKRIGAGWEKSPLFTLITREINQ